jgi:hypothetical protein
MFQLFALWLLVAGVGAVLVGSAIAAVVKLVRGK